MISFPHEVNNQCNDAPYSWARADVPLKCEDKLFFILMIMPPSTILLILSYAKKSAKVGRF